jgi:hypothetical protein
LENLDEDLEYCLRRVSFVFAFTFFSFSFLFTIVVVLIDFLFPRRLDCPRRSMRKGSLSQLRWQKLRSWSRWQLALTLDTRGTK